MGFHDCVFCVRKPFRLVQNQVWNPDLSDVVQQRRFSQILLLFFGKAELSGNQYGILRNTLRMLAGQDILCVHGFRDGKDRLIAHLNLLERKRQAFLLDRDGLLEADSCDKPGQPPHEQAADKEHVHKEPVVVMNRFLFGKAVGALLPDLTGIFVDDGEMEGVFSVGQIRVNDAAELTLRHGCISIVEALQIVGHLRVFHGIVHDFRHELNAAYVTADRQAGAALDRNRLPVQPDFRNHQTVGALLAPIGVQIHPHDTGIRREIEVLVPCQRVPCVLRRRSF